MSYQDVKNKLYRGHRRIANNTYLTLSDEETPVEYIDMRLHGNLIARFFPDQLNLYSAGWHTRTTKDRLNLALRLAGIVGKVSQKDWTWFLDIPCPSNSYGFHDGMGIDYAGEVYN